MLGLICWSPSCLHFIIAARMADPSATSGEFTRRLSTALRFANFILFSILSLFSHLVAVFIVARISSSSHFCHVCHLGLDSVFLRVCSVGLEGCLCIKLELWFFGGWLPFSLPQSFVVLRWHGRLALVYGASYLLAGGWAFGALGMCLPTSC
ncbi:hypothetical protein DY000_02042516 [Brassica cretica]|uniref:Transmembrane protein n=1 Tax=Brassica cretica TaxID=69181 RepID=A0ABQ7BLL3_BRACR|nr:hypothetical protein DY000_02042516 [Brassica cretica]